MIVWNSFIVTNKFITQPAFPWPKSTMETPEQFVKFLRSSGFVIVDFEKISHVVLVIPLLALNK